MTDRAQSEVLGFVLVFAVVLAAVGVLTATGTAGLEDTRETARVENAERVMGVLADNLADLATGAAPSRATEMDTAGGSVGFGDPVTVNVSGHRVGAPSDNFSYDVTFRPVVYDAPGDRTRLVYATGAVFRVDRGSAVTLRDLDAVVSTDGVVLPVIQTRVDGPTSVGGAGHALVRTVWSDTTLLVAERATHDVTVTITSPRAAAWARTLDARDGVDCSVSGDTVTCAVTTDNVYVTVVRTDVTLE